MFSGLTSRFNLVTFFHEFYPYNYLERVSNRIILFTKTNCRVLRAVSHRLHCRIYSTRHIHISERQNCRGPDDSHQSRMKYNLFKIYIRLNS